jgi:hypothetical protein
MGYPEYHPSPSHTPPIQAATGSSWSSIARKNSNMIDTQNWRSETSRCTCPLSIRPESTDEDFKSINLDRVVFYAHQLDSFQKAHGNFDAVKDLWTPELFGQMIGMINDAGCTKLDGAVRDFHQAIRNNGLWQCWIDQVERYPRFEALLLDELAHVLENLSPRYLKDVKIEHLEKIFGTSADEQFPNQIHGKKRKLKRQITKWIETQSDEVLDENWKKINNLKWRLQCVIDQKDKEQEERSRNKAAYNYNWRSKAPRTTSPAHATFAAHKECWPELRKAFETGGGSIQIGA